MPSLLPLLSEIVGKVSPSPILYQDTNSKSLIFDGVNDTLRITDSTTAPTPFQSIGNENAYSISFWMKSTNENASSIYWYSSATMIEIRTQTSSGTHTPFSIGLKSGSIFFGRTSDRDWETNK